MHCRCQDSVAFAGESSASKLEITFDKLAIRNKYLLVFLLA